MGVGGGLRAKYMLPRFRIRDSIEFGMQPDHVLEKLNFDLLTPGSGDKGERGSMGKIFATILLHSCDMQHDHVRKKLNFDVLTHPLSPPRGLAQAFEQKSCLICFLFIVTLSACEISVKNNDN